MGGRVDGALERNGVSNLGSLEVWGENNKDVKFGGELGEQPETKPHIYE